VIRRGEEIELSRKEFDLLALFASRLGQVVTREVCLDTLWWGLELSDTRTLDTHVKRLRQKIENDPPTLVTSSLFVEWDSGSTPNLAFMQKGDLAPDFKLDDQNGNERTLSTMLLTVPWCFSSTPPR